LLIRHILGVKTRFLQQWGKGCCAPFPGGSWVPICNTVSTGPRPTSIPTGILIQPTDWPQYTNVTDRQTDRQTDNRTTVP